MRALSLRLLLASAALALCSCTLITGDFTECDADDQCGEGRVCRERYCVVNTVPQGCGRVEGRTDAANAIVLGAALPLTPGGTTDESEVQGLNAILLALDEVNQREGVGGRPFVLHVCDSEADSERVKAQAAWLADDRQAAAIITSGSGQTIAASSQTVSRGTLLMTATATSPELTSLLDKGSGTVGLVWRTVSSDAIQGRVIADILVNDAAFQSVNKIGVIFVKDPYGEGLASVLSGELAAAPGKSLRLSDYQRQGAIDTAVSQLNDFDPDLTVLVGFPDDAVRILNAASGTTNLAAGSGHKWFFTDSAKSLDLFTGLTDPSQIEGAFGTTPAQGAGGAYTLFSSSFQARYQQDPANFAFTSHSYDAMYLLALGSAWAVGDGTGEVTGARIAEGLTKVSSGMQVTLSPSKFTDGKSALQQGQSIDVVGASGNLNFDPVTGEAPGPVEVWKVQGSGFETVEAKREPPGG